jgi:hypothetical protein
VEAKKGAAEARLFMRKKRGKVSRTPFYMDSVSRSEREEDVRKYSRFPGRADGLIVLR